MVNSNPIYFLYNLKNYYFPSFDYVWNKFWNNGQVKTSNLMIFTSEEKDGSFIANVNFYDELSIQNYLNKKNKFLSEEIIKAEFYKFDPPIVKFTTTLRDRYPKRIKKIIKKFEEEYQKRVLTRAAK